MADGSDVPSSPLGDPSVCTAPLYDARRISPVHRDARDVHADDPEPRERGGQAGSVHGEPLTAGHAHRQRHRAADEVQGRGDGGARVGRPAT